ncbi:MAG TPA: SIMPL domain-containing protein [Bryobacteraceae bacterium]|jgi:hypothetical protein
MKLIRAVFFTALAAMAQTPAPRSTVQATGTATVSVTPDQAQVNVSAVTTAATAQDAANQNATIATNIQMQITQALGTSGTVKTVNYSVTPNYTYNKDGSSTLNGYTVTNSIQVTLNDLTITGKIIDTAVQAGASRIDSLVFTLKDDTDARSQALKAATLKAKTKADAMAASVGLTTGPILAIQEAGAVVNPITTVASPGATASTPVQPGNLSVTGNVTIAVQLSQ